jgi:hypothetical protein
LRLAPWTAAIVVLAVAKPADDANRSALGVDDDHRVQTIGFAGTAQVFERFAGSVRTGHDRRVTVSVRGRLWSDRDGLYALVTEILRLETS